MVKEFKKKAVEDIKERLDANKVIYFVGYKGLTVESVSNLRENLKSNNSEMKVYKNTLISRALKEVMDGVSDDVFNVFVNPTAIVTSKDDPIAPAKVLKDFVKTKEMLVSKGGVVDGVYLDEESINKMASLPSREVLIAKLLMLLNSPITGFVNVLQGNVREFVNVLHAIKDKKSA